VVDHFSQLLNRCLFNLELVRVGDGDRSCFLFCDFFGEDGTGLITGDWVQTTFCWLPCLLP
jgi:hypothetical protein